MKTIELAGVNGSLSITPDESGWSQVVLHQDDKTCALGAETLKLIVSKLRAFLSQSSSGMKWVFSLSELHSSVYGEHGQGRVLLKIQDADGHTTATLEVTAEQQDRWRSALQATGSR